MLVERYPHVIAVEPSDGMRRLLQHVVLGAESRSRAVPGIARVLRPGGGCVICFQPLAVVVSPDAASRGEASPRGRL